MAKSNEAEQPGDVSTDGGPEELEDLDAADSNAQGGEGTSSGGMTNPRDVWPQK